jgi:hypothetical protein
MANFKILTKCYQDDKIEEDNMDGECAMQGRENKYFRGLGRETSRKETLQKLVVHGRIILKWILKR